MWLKWDKQSRLSKNTIEAWDRRTKAVAVLEGKEGPEKAKSDEYRVGKTFFAAPLAN